MYYSLRHCLYSKTAHSDLSTVLPLTETSGGKPPCLAHSAHVLLSRAEQLKAAPSFPVSRALPNEAWPAVSSPPQPGPHGRISRKLLQQSRTLNLLLICFSPLWSWSVSHSTSIPLADCHCEDWQTNIHTYGVIQPLQPLTLLSVLYISFCVFSLSPLKWAERIVHAHYVVWEGRLWKHVV